MRTHLILSTLALVASPVLHAACKLSPRGLRRAVFIAL